MQWFGRYNNVDIISASSDSQVMIMTGTLHDDRRQAKSNRHAGVKKHTQVSPLHSVLFSLELWRHGRHLGRHIKQLHMSRSGCGCCTKCFGHLLQHWRQAKVFDVNLRRHSVLISLSIVSPEYVSCNRSNPRWMQAASNNGSGWCDRRDDESLADSTKAGAERSSQQT